MKKFKYKYSGKFKPLKLKSTNIDRLSTALVPKNSKVLELGCATGYMTQYFRQQLNCQVTSVDINSAVKPDIVGDLEDKTIQAQIKKVGPYDVVFASAIIEHLKQPEDILQLIKSALKAKGFLIITTPNIAHWRMRSNLLLGRWDYQNYGLLDKTHLRFFTYKTFQNLLLTAGFKIIDVKIDPAGGFKYFNWLFKHFPNFYAYQIVIKAQKS